MNATTTRQDFSVIYNVFPTWNAPLSSLPLRYTYDGKEYFGMPENTRISREFIDANIFRATYIGILENTLEIKLEFTEYRDYPVREWGVTITNITGENSAIIENIVMGGNFEGTFEKLVYSNGETINNDGFTVFEEYLKDSDSFSLESIFGFSCRDAFPYMQLWMADKSYRIAIGYSGMWRANLNRIENGVSYTVGQKRCHMYLKPNETIIVPKLTIMANAGDDAHSRNLWRRWYFDHILPREFGEKIKPTYILHNWMCEDKEEFTAATEENQCGALQRYVDHGLVPDIWWVDAGWFPCNGSWIDTGSWFPDPERFPNGLAPIGKLCEKYGTRFLLWFEPERVRPNEGTWLEVNHPEWIIHKFQFDFSREVCRDWMTNHVDNLIKESHVHVYRQDSNKNVGDAWEEAEEDDRLGAMENQHVQNYLKYWDELLLRNPGLWIDSCAGGGKRNDLETMRRAVPLQYTDIGLGLPLVKQKQYRLMFEWIPYFRSHNQCWDVNGEYTEQAYSTFIDGKRIFFRDTDEFAFQTAMTPSITSMTHYTSEDRVFAVDRKMVPIWRAAAELEMRGDYYPLTKCRMCASDWYAMQFDDSSAQDGFVQVLSNIKVAEESFTAMMHIEPGRVYTFTERSTGETFTKTSEELENGLTVTTPPRSAKLYFYTWENK